MTVHPCGMSENSPKILNIKQLAERLGKPTVTVRYWLRVGKCPIPHIEGMKPPKWLAADVDAFLAGRDSGEAS
jgi:hypothetical protein